MGRTRNSKRTMKKQKGGELSPNQQNELVRILNDFLRLSPPITDFDNIPSNVKTDICINSRKINDIRNRSMNYNNLFKNYILFHCNQTSKEKNNYYPYQQVRTNTTQKNTSTVKKPSAYEYADTIPKIYNEQNPYRNTTLDNGQPNPDYYLNEENMLANKNNTIFRKIYNELVKSPDDIYERNFDAFERDLAKIIKNRYSTSESESLKPSANAPESESLNPSANDSFLHSEKTKTVIPRKSFVTEDSLRERGRSLKRTEKNHPSMKPSTIKLPTTENRQSLLQEIEQRRQSYPTTPDASTTSIASTTLEERNPTLKSQSFENTPINIEQNTPSPIVYSPPVTRHDSPPVTRDEERHEEIKIIDDLRYEKMIKRIDDNIAKLDKRIRNMSNSMEEDSKDSVPINSHSHSIDSVPKVSDSMTQTTDSMTQTPDSMTQTPDSKERRIGYTRKKNEKTYGRRPGRGGKRRTKRRKSKRCFW